MDYDDPTCAVCRDCYGNLWDTEHDARLFSVMYMAFETQPNASDAEIAAQLAEQFPDECRADLERQVADVREAWRASGGPRWQGRRPGPGDGSL
jgi:hypothetical protein